MKTFVLVMGWYFAALLGGRLARIAITRKYPRQSATTPFIDALVVLEYGVITTWTTFLICSQ